MNSPRELTKMLVTIIKVRLAAENGLNRMGAL